MIGLKSYAVRAAAAAGAVLLSLVVAAPAHADGSHQRPQVANQWSVKGQPKSGGIHAMEGWDWLCEGQILQPDLSSVAGFEWGAYQNCTDKMPQHLAVRIMLCVQGPGGPGSYECDKYKAGNGGHIVVAYETRTDARLKSCNRSKYSTYVLDVYYIMANNEEHPAVESTQRKVKCYST